MLNGASATGDREGREHRAPARTTILIVEDDSAQLELGRRHLEQQSLEVVSAPSAEAAIEQYLAVAPDLILLDVGLPDRSGFDVCETIRSLPGGGAVPIIMITGLDDAQTVASAYECGASDFAAKPLNWTVLVNRVRILIEAGKTRRTLAASRSKLAAAESFANLGTWEYDLSAERLSASKESARLLAIDHAEPLSLEALLESVHPLDAPKVVEAFNKMAAELAPVSLEHRVIHTDGSVRSVRHRSTVHRDQAGRAVSVEGVVQDVTDLRRAEEKIRNLANYDRLTGLPNRHMFLELLEGSIARSERSGKMVAVIYLDIDRFKKINDTLGPELGDEVLASIADRLRVSLRRGDLLVWEQGPSVARWGGDKFLVLLHELDEITGSATAVRRLLRQLAIPFSVADSECFLTASAGISVYPTDADSGYALLQHAESAMYHAKDLGRNRPQFYSDWMNRSSERKLELENELHKALAEKQLHLVYQPMFAARDRAVIGCEALLRWTHPEFGPVGPAEFIPIAESAGLICPISDWILDTACREFRSWLDGGLPAIRLSINLSSYQFQESDFLTKFEQILERTGVQAGLLNVELTESGLGLGANRSLQAVQGLKALGVRVLVDDFGVGTSTLAHLRDFPIDGLKIDRSFVSGIGSDSNDSAIISAVTAMAHRLKLEVVAEGVETRNQLEFLRAEGCDSVQGFLLARPLAGDRFKDTFDTLGDRQVDSDAAAK